MMSLDIVIVDVNPQIQRKPFLKYMSTNQRGSFYIAMLWEELTSSSLSLYHRILTSTGPED